MTEKQVKIGLVLLGVIALSLFWMAIRPQAGRYEKRSNGSIFDTGTGKYGSVGGSVFGL